MPAPDFDSFKVANGELSSATKFNNFVQGVEDEFSDIDLDQLSGGSDGQVVTRVAGVWTAAAPPGGGGNFRPIDLRLPGTNAYFSGESLTDWISPFWGFTKDVDGKVYGIVDIPPNVTPSSPQIILRIGANATSGVTRLSVATKAVADNESMNPSALTSETAQDITVPGTARFRKDVTFNISETLAAGDILAVEVFHEGAHANDTLNADTMLWAAYLKVS